MPKSLWLPVLVAAPLLCAAWLIPQTSLAEWMLHPLRSHATEAAMQSAAWARWGWTLGALTLLAMPWMLRDARPMAAQPPSRARVWLLVAMVLAVAVRLLKADEGLWYDEIAALGTYVAQGPGPIIGNAYTTANHPLQSLLSWCALPLGVEPWIRLPSILSGAAAALGAWWIGRACREGTTLATWMAFAIAVLPAAVNAGSEARGYGLMIAASALSTGLLLMAMKHGGSWRWIAYAIVLALGVWGHLVTAMVGMGHAALALWMLRSPAARSIALRVLVAVACAAALSIALWSPALPDLLHTRSQFSASRGDEPTLLGHEGNMLLWNLLGMGALPRPGVGSGAIWGAFLVLPLLAIGLRGCFADRGARRALAASALGLPIALALVWVAGSWFYARFMLFSLPGVALVAGVGAANLMRTRSGNGIGRWLPLVPVVMAFIAWPLFCTVGPRQPIREAVAWVAANRGPGDVIVGIGIADDVVQWYAMANRLTVHSTGLNGATAPETIARLRPRWIIQLYPQHTTRPETVVAAEQLGSWKTRTFRGSIDDGDVVVLQRTP